MATLIGSALCIWTIVIGRDLLALLGVCQLVGCMHTGRVHVYWLDACIQVACIARIGSDWMQWMWGQWVCFAACWRQHAWACILSMFGACMPAYMHLTSHLHGYCTCACIDVCYCVALMLHLHWNSCLRLHLHRRLHRPLSPAALASHLRLPSGCC